MLLFAVLITLLASYATIQVRFFIRRRRLAYLTVDELLGRIQPVNIRAVAAIAETFLNPSKSQLELEPPVMWESIGEMEGLEALVKNADAILDLAAFAARWNRTEGRIVTEMIRRDGVRLKRAAFKIQLASYFSFGTVFAPFQLQEAAAAYYLMRRRVLGLYEAAHVGLYPQLIATL